MNPRFLTQNHIRIQPGVFQAVIPPDPRPRGYPAWETVILRHRLKAYKWRWNQTLTPLVGIFRLVSAWQLLKYLGLHVTDLVLILPRRFLVLLLFEFSPPWSRGSFDIGLRDWVRRQGRWIGEEYNLAGCGIGLRKSPEGGAECWESWKSWPPGILALEAGGMEPEWKGLSLPFTRSTHWICVSLRGGQNVSRHSARIRREKRWQARSMRRDRQHGKS